MRDIDDILVDVVEALEPREIADPHSPLWVFHDGDMLQNLHVDTGALIDAARKTGRAHVTVSTGEDKVWASTVDGAKSWVYRGVGGECATPTRDLVIVALALALGVETGE